MWGTRITGRMNVTRAVLPVMRKQRSGHIISSSSTAGLVGFAFCSAYAAAKFGLEGWMESLQQEVAPYGITTTIVRSEEHTSELQSQSNLVCRLLLEKKKKQRITSDTSGTKP